MYRFEAPYLINRLTKKKMDSGYKHTSKTDRKKRQHWIDLRQADLRETNRTERILDLR